MEHLKKKKGSITLFTLVSMLFLTIMIVSIYINIVNSNLVGEKELQRTKEIYGQDVENAEDIYQEILQRDEQKGVYDQFDIEQGVNVPLLTDEMTAVKWNGTAFEDVENPETDSWYDYVNREWANMRVNNTIFVWIPRYAYKITYQNQNDKSQGGTIDVKFLPETTNTPADRTDTVPIYEVYQLNESQNYQTEKGLPKTLAAELTGAGALSMTEYVVHPAFRFGDRALTGIWVEKEEHRNGS